MKNDSLYLGVGIAVVVLVVIFYRQHHLGVIKKIKQQQLLPQGETDIASTIQPEPPQGIPIEPILINAPASMFQVPVDRNNVVVVPVNLPPGVTPAVI